MFNCYLLLTVPTWRYDDDTLRYDTLHYDALRYDDDDYYAPSTTLRTGSKLDNIISFHFMLFGPFYATLSRQDALFLLNSALKAKLFTVIPKSFCIFAY